MIKQLKIESHKKDEVIDITDKVLALLADEKETPGICTTFVSHTTCCLTTADLDPGTDEDLLQALRNLLPKLSYNHPHNPLHTPDHILSSIIGPSLSIPYESNKLILGTWQRIILIELDGPRERLVNVCCKSLI